jgi:hypothetical protein
MSTSVLIDTKGDTMETFEHRYSTVLVMARQGTKDGKPFFGFVNLKTTWAEWEAKLHYQVAQLAAIDQGCAPEPIVCCDLEDLPEFMQRGLGSIQPNEQSQLLAFEVLPRHYERARQLATTELHDNSAKKSAVTDFTIRTQTFSDDTYSLVTAPRLADALHRAATLIDELTNPASAEVLVGVQYVTDEQGKKTPLYGVRIDYEPSK